METKQYAAAGPWISVKEELPIPGRPVLVKGIYAGKPDWGVAWQLDGIWTGALEDVTHWAEVRV